MIFKSSTVALTISSIVAFSANATDLELVKNKVSTKEVNQSAMTQQSDKKTTFIKQDETIGVYLIRLSEKSALDSKYNALGDDRTAIIKKIDLQQRVLIEKIKSLDTDAIITQKARLTENAIYVQIKHSIVESLKASTDVLTIEQLNEAAVYTAADEFKKFPFLTVNNPNDDVTVAIIANGVDYTHKSLGGKGTAEAYDSAWANKSNAWDGFPTDTVIGGLDFSANFEGYHTIDYNPLEMDDDPYVEDGQLPSGTAIAAKVLEHAPNAKIIAYKTADWDRDYFNPVLDVVLDPNQDGNLSDRPDIILINAWGNAAFYEEIDGNASGFTREINLIRRLSASGSLVVVGAGDTHYESAYNIAWRGAVPEALTVGSVIVNDESITLAEFTPAGPVRGSQNLKPEVVAPAQSLMSPLVGSGDEHRELPPKSSYAAAYAAGNAAAILAKQPHLNSLQLKALIANSANSADIKGTIHQNPESGAIKSSIAEVAFMGAGLVDIARAEKSKAIVWDSQNYQPGLGFGFVEATNNASVIKDITIQNLTDSVQTYRISHSKNGVKVNNQAISFIYPESINVPANGAVSFSLTMTVNAELLGAWPIKSSDDYTMAKWTEASVNGYLMFTNIAGENAEPSLTMPWQVFPKNNTELVKSNRMSIETITPPFEHPEYLQAIYDSETWFDIQFMQLTNSTNADKTLLALPIMHQVKSKAPSKAAGHGNLYRNISSSVVAVPTAMCESGKKLAVGVEYFDKFDLPMAEHWDKAGHVLAYFSIYNKEVSDLYEANPKDLQGNALESETLAYLELILDNNGQLKTKYIDFNMEFDKTQPTARFKYSKLAADGAPGDNVAVANICVDELYHDEFQSPAVWNDDLGWQFASDRDAQSTTKGPVIRFNPVLGGTYQVNTIDRTGEYNYPPYTYRNCDPNGTDNYGNPRPAGYCLDEEIAFLANISGVSLLDENSEVTTWSNKVVVPAGGSALIAVAPSMDCNIYGFYTGGEKEVHEDCYPGVSIFEIGNDNAGFTGTDFHYDSALKGGQSFTVYENTANDTVVGTVNLASEVFFYEDSGRGEVYLVNSLPGTPFRVETDGTIIVNNSAAIDYETHKTLTLQIQVDYVNRDSMITELTIVINNRNDIAPNQVNEIADVEIAVGETVSVSIGGSFADAEGDGLVYLASDLPIGLSMDRAGNISGSSAKPGTYISTITATDSINQSTTQVTFTVKAVKSPTAPEAAVPEVAAQEDSSSAGGSTTPVLLMLTAFALVRRRLKK